MRLLRPGYIIAAIASIPVIVVLLWMFALPDAVLIQYMEERAADQGVYLKAEGLSKGPLLSFRFDEIKVGWADTPLVTLFDFSGRIKPLRLLLLELNVPFSSLVGEGTLSGTVIADSKTVNADLMLRGLNIDDIASMQRLGTGRIEADIKMNGPVVNAEFSASDCVLRDITASGELLPLSFFDTIRGAIDFNGKTVDIKSVSLSGEKAYARLQGTVENGMADLKLEIMPDPDLMPEGMLENLLGRYRISPGYYVIPIKRKVNI